MKTIVSVLTGLGLCFVVSMQADMNNGSDQGKKGVPPFSVHPSLLPTEQRAEAEEKMRQWVRQQGELRRRERESKRTPGEVRVNEEWKAITKNPGTQPGDSKTALPYIRFDEMSPELRQRWENGLRKSEIENATQGPSRLLVAIVGERPYADLRTIWGVAAMAASQVKSGYYTLDQGVIEIKQQLNPRIALTEEQARKLLAVTPLDRLWTKD